MPKYELLTNVKALHCILKHICIKNEIDQLLSGFVQSTWPHLPGWTASCRSRSWLFIVTLIGHLKQGVFAWYCSKLLSVLPLVFGFVTELLLEFILSR